MKEGKDDVCKLFLWNVRSVVDHAHLRRIVVIEGHAHPVKVHATAADAIGLVGSNEDEVQHLLVGEPGGVAMSVGAMVRRGPDIHPLAPRAGLQSREV